MGPKLPILFGGQNLYQLCFPHCISIVSKNNRSKQRIPYYLGQRTYPHLGQYYLVNFSFFYGLFLPYLLFRLIF